MRLLRVALARVRALFRRNVIADEIRDEMQFHIDQRTSEFRAQGLSIEEARRAALRRFGNRGVMADRGYDIRGAGWGESVAQDIRYGVRTLARQRGFAATTILTLALAMGAATALFSVIDAALLRPVPYPNPERIVDITVQTKGPDGQMTGGMAPSADDLDAWARSASVFSHLGRGRIDNERLLVEHQETQRLDVSSISPGFLDVFGVAPLLGRTVHADDARPGAPAVVWLGYDFWQRAFKGDASVLGTTLRVDGAPATIVGVIPRGFYRTSALWRTMPQDEGAIRSRRGSGTPTYGRLRDGVSPRDAEKILTAMSPPEPGRDGPIEIRIALQSLYDDTVERYRPAVRLLAASVALVILIACLNVSGLLLARGAAREGELAVRAAMGAGRLRIVRQLLTESFIIALAGSIGGLLVAGVALDGLVGILPLSLPTNAPPAINVTVLTFSLGLCCIVTLVTGTAPALRLSRVSVQPALSRAGRHHRTSLSRRGGQLLVGAEVALALVLLIGAGLMLRSLEKAMDTEPGFDPAKFITMEVLPIQTGASAASEYFRTLLDTLRANPRVEAAGVTTSLPMKGGTYSSATTRDGGRLFAAFRSVTPGYLEAIGITPQEGRLLQEQDMISGEGAVLAESAARQLFPDGPAVGRQFTLMRKVHTVVGVVPDVRNRSLLHPDPERERDVYITLQHGTEDWAGGPFGRMPAVVVRPAGDIPASIDMLRRVALAIDIPVIVEGIDSGTALLGQDLETPRNRSLLFGLMSGLGLCLTLVGIFGITAYAVASRTHEIGVRMAFGASASDVVRRMTRDTAWPVVIGALAGLATAYYGGRFIESFLYETPPRDPITLALVTAGTIVVTIAAAWIPARRAARVDPLVALRSE